MKSTRKAIFYKREDLRRNARGNVEPGRCSYVIIICCCYNRVTLPMIIFYLVPIKLLYDDYLHSTMQCSEMQSNTMQRNTTRRDTTRRDTTQRERHNKT